MEITVSIPKESWLYEYIHDNYLRYDTDDNTSKYNYDNVLPDVLDELRKYEYELVEHDCITGMIQKTIVIQIYHDVRLSNQIFD